MYTIIVVHITDNNCEVCLYLGYEPAGLTVHPPPQNDRGWVYFFRMGV